MEKDFAIRLMERPLNCRWIKAPSPNGVKIIAGLLAGVVGDEAIVFCSDYKHNYRVKLSTVSYR